MTEATASNYWISSTALSITLNAMGDADYIQANAASGAMIMCYMRDIDGLGYDNGHNYRRWPLVANPTYFNSTSEKYVYAAIPRDDNADNATALIVYPSERVDVYGISASGDQLGSTDYYYIFLGGIISASVVNGVLQQRTWSQRVDSGKLASDEAIANGGDNTWWIYNAVDNTVAFLKTITKAVFDYIETKVINLSGSKLTSVASEGTPITSKNAVVTPDYLFGNSDNRYIRKDVIDVVRELITFLKGIAIGDGSTGIAADGVARLRALLLDNASIDADGRAAFASVVSDVLSSPGFAPGLTDGSGAGIYRDANGKWVVEADKLLVRLKMIVSMLEVRRLSYVGGDQVHSSAGSHITKTRILPSGDIRCYILADDGSTRTMNDWRVGDQAKCKTDNIKEGVYENVSNRYYWRLVVNTGEEVLDDGKVYNYVDLSDTRGTVKLTVEGVEHTCVGYDTSVDNDLPAEGDDIVQLGSQTDKERQYAYVIYVTEGKRVDYAGINDYDLNSHIVELHSKSGGFVHSDRFEIVSAAGTGVSQPIVCERGTWQSGMVYGHYDHVSHGNATWLCNVGRGMTTTSEPADGNPDWIKETYGMKGEGLTQLLLGLTSGDWFWREGQGIIATVEVAVVQGDTDITGTIHPSQLVWTRSSAATGTEDADWAARHTGDSFSLTVLADDMVGDVTTFICTLYSAHGEHIQSNSITI